MFLFLEGQMGEYWELPEKYGCFTYLDAVARNVFLFLGFGKIIIGFCFIFPMKLVLQWRRWDMNHNLSPFSQPYIKVSSDGCMTWHATAYTGPLVQKWNIAMSFCIWRKTPTPGRKSLIFSVINDVVIHHVWRCRVFGDVTPASCGYVSGELLSGQVEAGAGYCFNVRG